MRTPSLQYLYLQKPITMVVLICIVAVLPWIGIGSLSNECESQEVTIATSMLETKDWVLPQAYNLEIDYQPPMAYWLMTIFSLPQGHVSPFSARLPSALAYIVLIGFTLFFFGERIKFQEAFIGSLLLLSCLGMQRGGMISGTDMLFTAFIVLALYSLYRWENKLELKGLPIIIPILLGCAVLTKGLIGIILPLIIFCIHLIIIQKHSWITIFKSVFYIGVSAMFLPVIWYVAAWRDSGGDFWQIVSANSYNIGYGSGIQINLIGLVSGFMPWTIFFFFSLFGLKLYWPKKSLKQILIDCWQQFRSIEKIKRFSLIALLCIIIFFSFLPHKRSLYLLPAYPFIAVFLAQYAIYLTEYRTKVTRVFATFLLLGVCFIIISFFLGATGIIKPLPHINYFNYEGLTLSETGLAQGLLSKFGALFISTTLIILLATGTLIYQLFKKINIKILYATIALTIAVNFLINGIILRLMTE